MSDLLLIVASFSRQFLRSRVGREDRIEIKKIDDANRLTNETKMIILYTMKINTKIRYGLRMLVHLAEAKKIINTAELGERMLVSPKYLRKLAGPLERHQLIRSAQGIYGGYTLNKNPQDITLAMIFEAFAEDVNITGCTSKSGCPLNEECLTRPVWEHLENIISKEFQNITIQAIVENNFPG